MRRHDGPLRPQLALLLLRVLRAVEDDGLAAHRARCRRLFRLQRPMMRMGGPARRTGAA